MLTLLMITCSSANSEINKTYCGYELNQKEFSILQGKIKLQGSAYESDTKWQIYDQINDTIRNAMPDSDVFEIFLSLLNENEVGIDVFVPDNQEYFEKISCAMMNANYKGHMPEQNYMCIYTYTNPDGSGDTPFKVALKRKK